MTSKRLLFVVNEASFFLSHRLPIARAAKEEGYEVHVATGGSNLGDIKCIESEFYYHSFHLSRSGKKPLAEMKSILSMYRLFRRVKPSIVHLVTIKPVLYGGIVGRLVNIPAIVSAVSGLGSVFVSKGRQASLIRILVQKLYRLAFMHKNITVIFQNPDDRDALIGIGAIKFEQTTLVRGSGVDLRDYPFVEEPNTNAVTVVFSARLLREKGIVEFVEAANALTNKGVGAKFLVVGDRDPGNPSSVSEQDINNWRAKGCVEFFGFCSDIPKLLTEASLVVLPSYREGLPKSLVEAAAAGRPVVTTDVPGCRDAIVPGVTGILVPVKNTEALTKAIEKLIEDRHLRKKMGIAGRHLAESDFRIEKIISAHLSIYSERLRCAK